MGFRPSFPAILYTPSPLLGPLDSPLASQALPRLWLNHLAGKPLMCAGRNIWKKGMDAGHAFCQLLGKLPKTGTSGSCLYDWCTGTPLLSIKGITDVLACPPSQSV